MILMLWEARNQIGVASYPTMMVANDQIDYPILACMIFHLASLLFITVNDPCPFFKFIIFKFIIFKLFCMFAFNGIHSLGTDIGIRYMYV